MNKKNRLKLLFKSLFVQFGQVQCDNGVILLWDEDTELMVGYNVYVEQETENGEIEYVAPENGEYVSNNTTFVIEDGKCTEIRNNEEPAQEPETPAQEETSAEAQEPEQEPEQPAEEPAQEPEFNAEQAIADLRAEYDAKFNELTNQLSEMRVQLDALLALPQEESAFNKETKEENQTKPIFKSKNKK